MTHFVSLCHIARFQPNDSSVFSMMVYWNYYLRSTLHTTVILH